jgi:hypothetical protein
MITWPTTAWLWEIYIVVNMYGDLQVTGYYFTDESVLSMCYLYSQFYLLSVMYMINMITWPTTASLWEIYIVVNMYGDLQVIILQMNQYWQCVVYIPNFVYFLYSKCWISSAVIFIFYEDDLNYVYLIWRSNNIKKKWKDRTSNTVVSNHVNSDHVPSFFFVLTSEMLGRLLPVYTLLVLLWQRQHIIVVDAMDDT